MEINRYNEGKIYKITSPNSNKIYIGSTVQKLYARFSKHKEMKDNCVSKEIIGAGSPKIELLEAYPCKSREELLEKEQYYIDLNKDICINKIGARHDKEEYYKKYMTEEKKKEARERANKFYKDNKEHVLETIKKYREENKEEIKTKHKEYYEKNKEEIYKKSKEHKATKADEIKEYMKEYHLKNKEKATARANTIIKCECGLDIKKGYRSEHIKTKKHIDLINKL